MLFMLPPNPVPPSPSAGERLIEAILNWLVQLADSRSHKRLTFEVKTNFVKRNVWRVMVPNGSELSLTLVVVDVTVWCVCTKVSDSGR